MKIKNYDNFFLGAEDVEKSKVFYTDILGLAVKFDFSDKGLIAFRVGDQEPAIILKDQKKFPDTKPTIWFEVEDVKSQYDFLKSKGLQFISEPYKIQTGWAVEFLDPSGNKLGFADNHKS